MWEEHANSTWKDPGPGGPRLVLGDSGPPLHRLGLNTSRRNLERKRSGRFIRVELGGWGAWLS